METKAGYLHLTNGSKACGRGLNATVSTQKNINSSGAEDTVSLQQVCMCVITTVITLLL